MPRHIDIFVVYVIVRYQQAPCQRKMSPFDRILGNICPTPQQSHDLDLLKDRL